MGGILIGTSGFSFDDWVGEVYPARIKKQEMLSYYEHAFGFNALEVNYTYYTMPSKKTMESFSARTSEDFSFVVKAYKGMTHVRTGDIHEQCGLFKEGIKPLGKGLKALLFQFPYNFLPDSKNMDYLNLLRQEFDDYGSVVEFRNAKWSDDHYIKILKELDLGYCIVDEPELKGLLPFRPVLTSDIGYFRFHGRNKEWFKAPMNVRYDYLYSKEELAGFVEPIKNISERAGETFVFFNNCHLGKAVRNAQMLKEMLEETVHG